MENAPGFPYEFKDAELAAACSAHGSDKFNQLEWLGDRVLGGAIAQLLQQRYPEHGVDKLNLAFIRLVNNDNLSAVSKKLGLVQPHNARRPAADTLEAHLGAVMLDAGWDEACACVERIFGEQIETLPPSCWLRDAKSSLKEYAERRLNLPEYHYRKTDEGFIATCLFHDKQTTGTGSSKKEAAHVAATDMLMKLQAEDSAEKKAEEA